MWSVVEILSLDRGIISVLLTPLLSVSLSGFKGLENSPPEFSVWARSDTV